MKPEKRTGLIMKKCSTFLKGMAVGLMASGAVVCVMSLQKQKSCGSSLGKMLKSAGKALENLSGVLGL